MTMELTPDELKLIEERRAVEAARRGVGITGEVIRQDGCLTATRYYGGHHPQYAVYDGDAMICLCVYKKGALNAMDLHTREMGFEYMRTLDINND